MASQGEGISGGDRIYIEFAKNWSKNFEIDIITWKEGINMMKRNDLLPNRKIHIHTLNNNKHMEYIPRIIHSIKYAINLKLDPTEKIFVYMSSEFWMDCFGGVIVKYRYPQISLVATWYQTAPNPLNGFGKNRYRFKSIPYWFVQQISKPLIRKYADIVFVNNDLEKKEFLEKKTISVLGAVNIPKIISEKKMKPSIKKYEAVFQGRFHPQKGVEELIDIWSRVVKRMPNARLCMIGDGELKTSVVKKIREKKLENNIELKGYVFDGDKKNQLFSQSKLVLHPAYYDSGGMASAEAMIFGLPCIAFDLPAYDMYYPVGMIKIPTGNLDEFANKVYELLMDKKIRNRIGRQGAEYIKKHSTWKIRSEEILKKMTNNED